MTLAPILWNTNVQSSKNQGSICSGTAQILDENDTVASHTAAFQDSLFISSSTFLDDTEVKGKKKNALCAWVLKQKQVQCVWGYCWYMMSMCYSLWHHAQYIPDIFSGTREERRKQSRANQNLQLPTNFNTGMESSGHSQLLIPFQWELLQGVHNLFSISWQQQNCCLPPSLSDSHEGC